ncbi:MAG: Flp pilus assembly complex ATPase component TadA [Candidatus Aenigmarchaeota archaeon]|nr:Flp pilus assembly complex ATPase component TadA [Candidatus Aenigmarchaeota archaeon]
MEKEKQKIQKEKIVPDTSVIISGILSDLIEKGELKDVEVIIPEFVLEELRSQASRGREIGFKGLEEIKKIRHLEKEGKVMIVRTGRRQTMEEIQLAKYGRIDALILDVARQEDATMYTSDMVQALVSEAESIKTRYFKPYEKKKETVLASMFTDDTMSIHLKENCVPLAKRGKPGDFRLVKIRDEKITPEELEGIIKDVMDAARYEEDSFIEVGGHAASVIQLGNMRIAIARPPFSDGIEVTVVRPIAKLTLDDYKLSEKLKERLAKRADGILVAGPPGSGKSTFVASVAEFYEEQGKIVKTMESPRDLQVRPEITQYAKLHGKFENTADLLLLVRPDYTIFDEVRKTDDFIVFSDMRLAGIGMVGVVHATDPVDAVQRFIGRVELGIIPHIIDTIIYIKAGRIEKVYNLSLVVRTPTGMTEADLARPVVEVRSFEDNMLEYEIYTYGEENVIIPVKGSKESAVNKLAKRYIMAEIRKFDKTAGVELTESGAVIRVENDVIPILIGKKGKTIKELEEKFGLRIDVSPKVATLGNEVNYLTEESGAYITFVFSDRLVGKAANFYVKEDYLFSATIGKNGQVRVAKDSDVGKEVLKALVREDLKAFA